MRVAISRIEISGSVAIHVALSQQWCRQEPRKRDDRQISALTGESLRRFRLEPSDEFSMMDSS